MKDLDGDTFCIRLIGDYPFLAEKEVIYSLEEANFNYEYLGTKGLLLFLKGSEILIPYLIYRCSKIREIIKIIHICSINDINSLKDINFDFQGSFIVRLHSFDREYKDKVPKFEREIGAIIHGKGKKVDLKNPDNFFLGYILNGVLYFGKLIARNNRKQYFERRPSKKPFFHPSSMMPENARLMVNLSRAPISGVFLDPFCGAGGILIEAAFISEYCIGLDIDPKMIKGCKQNVKYYGLYNIDLLIGDALKLPFKRIDSIACDTPYGIAASLKKRKHEEMVEEFLRNLIPFRKLKICIATTKSDLEAKGYRMLLKYPQKVRKSLIRWLYVLELYDRDHFLGHIGK